MMKAVAAALVLIVGAAVVLWFGNMVNSWVLGGLLGGLAALLLSIPISLILFSYLARRHEGKSEDEDAFERRRIEVEEILYARAPERLPRWRVEERAEQEWEEEGWEDVRLATSYDYSSPRRALPEPGRTQSQHPSKRLASAEPGSQRSRYQSEALRVARKEALQQSQPVEILPPYMSRRLAQSREPQTDFEHKRTSKSTRSLQTGKQRRIIEADPYPTQNTHSERPSRSLRRSSIDPETDIFESRTMEFETTDAALWAVTDEEELQQEDNYTTGSLHRPLVRRAPYMYEDDPIRQRLSQHLDRPITKRSSRTQQ